MATQPRTAPRPAPQKVSATPVLSSILDRPSNTIERPKPLPAGSYLCVVKTLPTFDKSSRKGTEFAEFALHVQEALDDVDSEKLEEMGGISEKILREKFYITEAAAWRLTEFLDALKAGEPEQSSRERIDQSINCQVIVKLRNKPTQDGKGSFAEVAEFAAVED